MAGVIRGGRGPSKAQQEAEVARAIEAKREAALQMAQDLRVLAPRPEFRRFIATVVRESQMFGVPVGWPHDALREWTGRAALGHKVFEWVTAADETFAADLLTLSTTPPQQDTPHE